MKTLKHASTSLLLILALLSGQFAVSCSSDPETEAADHVEISGLEDELRFPHSPMENEAVNIKISSNKTWSISKSNLDWLTISQMNGGSNFPATITLTAKPNDDLERSGELTIYAGALVRTVTVTQEAFPIVPTITLSGITDNKLDFEFTDTEPVNFTLYSNVAWTADLEDLEWATVSPLSGERKKEITITVTPTANSGKERTGTITFRAEKATPVVVTVSQTAYRDEPILTVTGIDDENNVLLSHNPEQSFALQVLSNRNWNVSKSNLDWLTVSPDSGTAASNPIEVMLSAEQNTGKERIGTLTLHSEDPELKDLVITVIQEAKPNTLLAWWTVGNEQILLDKDKNSPNWTKDGVMIADLPTGTTASGEWHRMNPDDLYPASMSYIISSDGKGHYAIKPIWTDDYLEFTIPVKEFVAGSMVNIRFGISGTNPAPKYWFIEYWDEGQWKPTGTESFTYANGDKVTATFQLGKQNVVSNIDVTATFTEAITNGEIHIRLRCASGPHRVQNTTPLKAPNQSSTLRLRPWEGELAGENDAISFWLVSQ